MWYTIGWASVKEITANFMVEKGSGCTRGLLPQQYGDCVTSNVLYFASI